MARSRRRLLRRLARSRCSRQRDGGEEQSSEEEWRAKQEDAKVEGRRTAADADEDEGDGGGWVGGDGARRMGLWVSKRQTVL